MLVVTVFPLIWMGGLVTSTQAGMAVPDWPGTYGYNLFLYPWQEWFFGPWDLFVEHGHRLLGALAGLITVGLVIACFGTRQPKWVCHFSIVLLVLIIAQGALGGIRVLMDERMFALIHGCTGPLFFAFAVSFSVTTSRWWWRPLIPTSVGSRRARSLINMGRMLICLAFVQLVVGALLRHFPLDWRPAGFVHTAYLHVALAVLLVLLTAVHAIWIARWTAWSDGLRASMLWLVHLVVLQFLLGLTTWLLRYGFPLWFADWSIAQYYVIPHHEFWQTVLITGHVAMGSLILAFWTVHVVRGGRWWSIYRTPDSWEKGR
ncbi:MAG TPA: COX15/CtaA family protein [Pirellulaceae bacterium]|nr:COX15/CtaA family protein [Pirellulaceae bacterium]